LWRQCPIGHHDNPSAELRVESGFRQRQRLVDRRSDAAGLQSVERCGENEGIFARRNDLRPGSGGDQRDPVARRCCCDKGASALSRLFEAACPPSVAAILLEVSMISAV
jgi:hypothetical protein